MFFFFVFYALGIFYINFLILTVFCYLVHWINFFLICDAIKQNESEVKKYDFCFFSIFY